MKSYKTKVPRLILLLLMASIALILPFLPVSETENAGIGVFLGRFHPLIVHFPIVLVLLIIGWEAWFTYRDKLDKKAVRSEATINGSEAIPVASPSISFSVVSGLLLLTLISAFASVIIGYLLYRSGEYQGDLIRQHLWGGVLLTLALVGAVFFHWRLNNNKRHRGIYRIFLLLSGGILIYTSHVGGTITHGQDFLTEHLPSLRPLEASPIEKKKPQELQVFQDLIMPALENRCLSCHNEHKTKGGLLMTSLPQLLKGGKSEKPMIVPGNLAASELYHRITLPDNHDDHMPPPEKPPLDADAIALLRWWIAEGADPEMVVGIEPPDSMLAIIETYLPQLYRSERLKLRRKSERDKLAKELAGFGEELGLVIEPDPDSEEAYFAVSMQMPPKIIGDRTVAKLLSYAELFSKVSLPGSEITDDALFYLSKMPNLRQLYIPKTAIEGEGLVYLKDLKQLESLNLSFTMLTNTGILSLTYLTTLKEVYLFDHQVDSTVLKALDGHLDEVKILVEEGPYY